MIDIPPSKIKNYVSALKPHMRDAIVKAICDGEAAINAFDSEHGSILLQIISDRLIREIDVVLQMVRSGKFNEIEELRQIRKACIGINKIIELLMDLKDKIEVLERHAEQM